MIGAPKGIRLHVGIFGRRNVGKSSLLNAITRQQVAIVSDQAGTTTDPVEKPMELLPLGPVLFIDTAGIDDTGSLGELRTGRTRQVFERTDLGVLVSDGSWGIFEQSLFDELIGRNLPATTALASVDPCGFEQGLMAGANVIMPNLTPVDYRAQDQIYPTLIEAPDYMHRRVIENLKKAGRVPGPGRGDRIRKAGIKPLEKRLPALMNHINM